MWLLVIRAYDAGESVGVTAAENVSGVTPLVIAGNNTCAENYNENLYSPKTHGSYRQDTDILKRKKNINAMQITVTQ